MVLIELFEMGCFSGTVSALLLLLSGLCGGERRGNVVVIGTTMDPKYRRPNGGTREYLIIDR